MSETAARAEPFVTPPRPGTAWPDAAAVAQTLRREMEAALRRPHYGPVSVDANPLGIAVWLLENACGGQGDT